MVSRSPFVAEEGITVPRGVLFVSPVTLVAAVGAGAGHQRGVYILYPRTEEAHTRNHGPPSTTQRKSTETPHQHFRVKTAAAASNMALELAPVPCPPSTMRHTPMYCYLLRLSAGGSAEQARRGAPEGLLVAVRR